MNALDLFCCAGGATRGLQRAGFRVLGVDVDAHKNYCGDSFLLADATKLHVDFVRRFDFVWASPPCQQFTAYRRRDPAKVGATYPNLIPATRALLASAGVPYAIENVSGAPLRDPVVLCGSMFGLGVRRHRLIEAGGWSMARPACNHAAQRGDYPQATNRANRRKTCEVGVWRIPLDVQKVAMGVDWECTLRELSEMVPPAYAEHVARAAVNRLVDSTSY